MRKYTFLIGLMLCCLSASAQRSKMTSFVQKYAAQGAELAAEQAKASSGANSLQSDDSSAKYDSIPKLLVLLRCSDYNVLAPYNCAVLCAWDDIYAVNVPITELDNIAALPEVERIEANEAYSLANDKTATRTKASDAWTTAIGNKTGFTGKGVIVGVVDCGFDYTNPTFMNADRTDTRIKRVWDMLATSGGNTITADSFIENHLKDNNFIVPDYFKTGATYAGRLYTTSSEIKGLGGSTDSKAILHGTHVMGTAAGNGVPGISDAGNGKYKGMAPDADIVVVANCTTDNQTYWKNNDGLSKYSDIYNLVAYKYIYDYADSQKKPCVINLSQSLIAKSMVGTTKTDTLSYKLEVEAIQKMVGAGHIFCAAAGNNETSKNTNTIAFPACVDGVIGVGNAYYGDGRAYYIGGYNQTGEIFASSGRGPAPITGTIKPDVVAPGVCVVSAYNHYYNMSGRLDFIPNADYSYNNTTYRWLSLTGTSMSTPAVTGIVAQWLQLCPTLTPEQVLDVIKNTSVQDQAGVTYPNNTYGYGCIDALAGLKYIASTYTGIESVSADATVAGSDETPQYYDLLGRKVSESQAHGGIFLVRQGSKTIKVAR